VVASLVSLVVPPRCLACAAPPRHAEDVLCAACRRALPWLDGPCCPRCALPAPCAPCPAARAAFAAAWSPMAYAGAARALVGALKFHGRLPAAGLMAAQLAATAPPDLLDGATLVPVPADRVRRRARGFDHADRLARGLGRRAGLPVARPLRRTGARARQVGAGRSARLAAAHASVALCREPPGTVALVDDVYTTGATLEACARVLRDGGAHRVVALAYARTVRG